MADVRAFVAIEIPPAVRSALSRVRAEVNEAFPGSGSALRWVQASNVHLTLKFLGDVPEERVAEILAALTPAAHGHTPIELRVGEIGAFPSAERVQVLWAGLNGDLDRLNALRGAVEGALVSIGFAPESRAFQPHLTLARVKGRPLRGLGIGTVRLDETAFRAEDVVLVKSVLMPSGAVYTELGRVALRASA